jgi:hypothetical protein
MAMAMVNVWRKVGWLVLGLGLVSPPAPAVEALVEAESFTERGGWVVDGQFLDQMGSPYLLAHGLGRAVANARTVVELPQAGAYTVWVRAKDWVAAHHPGRFKVVVDGRALPATFGDDGRDWSWRNGGPCVVAERRVTVELQDLTGFDGRCDALWFTSEPQALPPDKPDETMAAWRRRLLGLPDTPPSAGEFDVVVVGGGIPGCAAALAAGRLGLRVALVQNRPLLGGNASAELGISPRGAGRSVVDEVAGASRERVLRAQRNVGLFLDQHVRRAVCRERRIVSVIAQHVTTGRELSFAAPVFVDCSGVGAVGFLAGADFRLGREASAEFGESLAPPRADALHHGSSPVFHTRQAAEPTTFPDVPWAIDVARDYADLGGQVTRPGRDNVGGLTHYWEYGQQLDPFVDAERIRDHLLCAVFGTFANAKRREPVKNARLELDWLGYVPAGGESRRLMGDYILTENDIRARRAFPDAVATNSGHFCLHYPGTRYSFRLGDWKWIAVAPFEVPFRCLYSRNVDNLLMAGKHISVSHIAGSATKTMLNGGQHGVAVGAAAFLCRQHRTTPRGVYEHHLAELQDIVRERGAYRMALRATQG